MDTYDYEYDSDADRYDRAVQREKELMKGIKKFETRTIYKSQNSPKDDEFLRYEFDHDLSHLIDFGIFNHGKQTQLTRFIPPLRTTFNSDNVAKTQLIVKSEVAAQGKAEARVGVHDDRKRVGDSIIEFPQTAIGYLQVEFSDNTVFCGTGSMIGPNHVLTAAHNVYDRMKPGRKIQSIHFWSGLKGDTLSFREVEVVRVIVLGKYQNIAIKNEEEYDLSVLILREPLGLSTGWFGLYNPEKIDAPFLKSYEIHGYPHDVPDRIQYCVHGKGFKANRETLEYDNGVSSGMNGGPIAVVRALTEFEREYYLIGVHLRDNKNLKKGVRLTKEKFDEVSEIVEFTFLNESLDDLFYGQVMSNTTQVSISFSFCRNVNTLSINNAFFALRFNTELLVLSISSKTLDHKPLLADESLDILKDSLLSLRRLHTLKLELYDCSKVTDNGILDLSKCFKNLTEMSNFSISLSNSKTITSHSVRELFYQLGNLPEITHLAVTFINLESCDDELINGVGIFIYDSEKIESLKLFFQSLPLTTETGFLHLVANMKDKYTLQNLSINMLGIPFSEKIKQVIKQQFSKLHHLSIM